MKKTSIVSLFIVFIMIASLLTSCMDQKPANDLELLIDSIENSSEPFGGSQNGEIPDFSKGMQAYLKADLGNMIGIKFDMEFVQVNGENPITGIKLNEMTMSGTSIKNISAYIAPEDFALAIEEVKSGYVGLKFANIEKFFSEKLFTEIPAETLIQIEGIKNSLLSVGNSAISEIPELTKKQIESLYNKLLEKKIITSETADDVTTIKFNGSGADFIEVFKTFTEELKNDENWNKFFTEVKEFLKSNIVVSSPDPIPVESDEEFFAYIAEHMGLEDIEESISSTSFDIKINVEKIKSLDNVTCVTGVDMTLTQDGETSTAKIEVNYEGDPSFRITLTTDDPTETTVISYTKKTENETTTTTEFSFTTDGEDVLKLTLEYNSETGIYKLSAPVNVEGVYQVITAEGTYKTSKEAIEFTVDYLGMDAILIRPNILITVTPIAEGSVTFPEYTELDKLSDEDLAKYMEYFNSFNSDDDIITLPSVY